MRCHFISIGGSIMHSLAISMHQQGWRVTGSDDEIFEPAKSNLERYGLLPKQIGWQPDNITSDIDIVVLGMHAKIDNPELLKAQELNLKIVSFPEFIYENSKDKKRVVIGGSHGKTTITSMVLHVLNELHIPADYLVGAKVAGLDNSVRLSNDAKILVVEGDEYLTSSIDRRPKFHLYHPDIALITGIAWDHCNVFPTYSNYVEQFSKFIELTEAGGSCIYFNEDRDLQEIATKAKNKIEYIPYETPDYSIENGEFCIKHDGKEYKMKVIGRHNMQNIMGAMAVCSKLGISNDSFLNAISTFSGAARRLELVYKSDATTIYRDFAHAPSKVAATVAAVKEQYPEKNVIAVFELHTYSSLNINFISQYRGSLKHADKKIIFFDPHALQIKNLPDLNGEEIKAAFNDNVEVCSEVSILKSLIINNTTNNDVILLMSSGNFGGLKWEELAKQ